jgi:Holliday junction resolvasome RuvABC endonuclease subunit
MTPNAPKVRVPKLKIPKIAGLPKPASTALTETRLTAPDYILGLDMSLEHTGWCLYNVKTGVRQEQVLEPNPTKSKKVTPVLGMRRLVWLRERVTNLAMWGAPERPTEGERISCLVMIEGYAFGAKGSSGISLGELGGVTRVALYDLNIPFIEIPPTQAKKFVTGRGNAKKEHMLMETLDRWGVKFLDDNICDAFGLVQLGRAITNTYDKPLLVFQKEVVSDVVKTWMKEHSDGTRTSA